MKKNIVSYRVLCLLFFLILSLIAGLRAGHDPDYLNYKEIYDYSGIVSNIDIEPAYLWLNIFLKNINVNFEGLVLIIAIFSLMIKSSVIIRYSEYVFLSAIIYISSIYIMFDLIAIRQGLSISFLMLAASYSASNKKIALLWVFIASLFHIASLIFLPMVFILGREFSKKFLMICLGFLIFIITTSSIFSFIDFLQNLNVIPGFVLSKLSVYSSYNNEGGYSYKQILVSIVAFIIYTRVECPQYVRSCCIIYIFGCVISSLFSSISDIAFRMKWFFLWGEIFFFPYILKFFWYKVKTPEAYVLLKMVFILLLLIVYIYPAYLLVLSIHERGFSLIF
ncbi:EpsG family protein [Pectobacterium polaris]|uniref:EpsG family protein n=1 Tax=Pectobacterium polaris TaxID=2042057 RepID=UPI000BB383A6|nr:EpsG family protein [Pectobacterium polaris]ASY76562.1 hypothetical protein BJJ97_11870 [Pectobacterium polaris]